MTYLSTLFVSLTLSCGIFGLKLPADFPKCSRTDSKLNECLKTAIEGALQIMAKGLPEFNLEPIDPIKVPSLTIGEGATGAVRVVQNYKNCQFFNIPKIKVQNVASVLTDDVFQLNVTFLAKEVYMLSQYMVDGNILLLRITGEGDCKIVLNIIGIFTEKKGKKYVEIDSSTVHLDPKKVEMDFKNLFNGDPKLGPEMNKILNENWKEIFGDVGHAYEESLGSIFKDVGNLIFKKVSYDEMFL
ncbi:hypothetical protein RI129_012391 [Pyrocoelia pectoralis]|uniref:Uncharacterized protein n=1 Tax=Pyrocoelia pectoralis TaxID=417401 RepID=A0AAN7V2M9_9COLE